MLHSSPRNHHRHEWSWDVAAWDAFDADVALWNFVLNVSCLILRDQEFYPKMDMKRENLLQVVIRKWKKYKLK